VVVGCSEAETLASQNRQRPAVLVQLLFGVARNGVPLVRLGTAISTLLGPERTTVVVLEGAMGLLFRNCPGMAWLLIPLEGAGDGAKVWWAAMGLWVGCWLRIAQWTRASCFL
jgi:hypothetical protein